MQLIGQQIVRSPDFAVLMVQNKLVEPISVTAFKLSAGLSERTKPLVAKAREPTRHRLQSWSQVMRLVPLSRQHAVHVGRSCATLCLVRSSFGDKACANPSEVSTDGNSDEADIFRTPRSGGRNRLGNLCMQEDTSASESH